MHYKKKNELTKEPEHTENNQRFITKKIETSWAKESTSFLSKRKYKYKMFFWGYSTWEALDMQLLVDEPK